MTNYKRTQRFVLTAVLCIFSLSAFAQPSAYERSAATPVAKPSDVQYHVYLKNPSQAATVVREQVIKAVPSGELEYLRKDVRQLGVIVKVNLQGQVTTAVVDYFTPINISENSKAVIGSIVKRNFAYDLTPQAIRYFNGIQKKSLTFYYELPVMYY